MSKITVYKYEQGSVITFDNYDSDKFATLDKIQNIKSKPIEGSAIEIDDFDLDGEGFYLLNKAE
jgi:hypothetical protein